MLGLEQICNTIKNFFTNVREPFPQLNRILLVCSMVRRPGLSTIQSVSNIVKDLNRLGIPTGPMPDGSANLTVGVIFASTKEHHRAIKKDMSIQVGITPGTINSTPAGNATPGMGFGCAN